jgi:hypothetical protein
VDSKTIRILIGGVLIDGRTEKMLIQFGGEENLRGH